MRAFLLSFLSPCGRIRRWPFWWRQLLLAVLLWFSTRIACYTGLLMFGSDAFGMKLASSLPPILSQFFAPTALASALSSIESWVYFYYLVEAKGTPPTGLGLGSGLTALLCYSIALLAGWSSLTLMLRRLRDTRVGLWGLPFCLTLLWVIPLLFAYVPIGDEILLIPFALSLIATLILALLPSRRDEPGTAEKP